MASAEHISVALNVGCVVLHLFYMVHFICSPGLWEINITISMIHVIISIVKTLNKHHDLDSSILFNFEDEYN